MQNICLQEKALGAAEIYSSQLHHLHRVKLFSAVICHVKQGSKIIVHNGQQSLATAADLIIFPADVEFEIINQPAQGAFRSDLLLLPAQLLNRFKMQYSGNSAPIQRSTLCAPLDADTALMWANLLHAMRSRPSARLLEHQAHGLLLALQQQGRLGALLAEQHLNLAAQVRQIILSAPVKPWTVNDVARHIPIGASTLRKRLQLESQGFRQIMTEVRMSHALSQLQSTRLPIGDIALQCGYLSSSRFSARFRQHYGCLPKNVR